VVPNQATACKSFLYEVVIQSVQYDLTCLLENYLFNLSPVATAESPELAWWGSAKWHSFLNL
jgi:hypothetical protein